MAELKVCEDVNVFNDEFAAKNREYFNKHNIFVLNIMGGPGSGKTTLLENILPILSKTYRTAVIEGDLATENDAERIRKTGVKALQIITDGECHLDAEMIGKECGKLNAAETDLLIIENVGNLVCPIEFDLGEDLRIVVLSTPEGEDKPLKYPPAMLHTNAVVISKIDLAGYVDVDIEKMKKYVTEINPKARIIEAGKKDGAYDANYVASYIIERLEAKKLG